MFKINNFILTHYKNIKLHALYIIDKEDEINVH
jgi:hypothetical protein